MKIAIDQAQEVLEQSMLGAWLQDPGAAAAAAQAHGTTARFFTKPDHATIFGAMQALTGRGSPVDSVTVFQMLANLGVAERVGGLAYLNDLCNCVPSARNVGHYASQLAERDKRRRDETTLVALARQAADPLLAGQQYETRKAEALADLQASASTPDMQAHPLWRCSWSSTLRPRPRAGSSRASSVTAWSSLPERTARERRVACCRCQWWRPACTYPATR